MRIIIGCVMVGDCWYRAPYLTAFHGHFGVMPTDKWTADGFDWSIHRLSSDPRVHFILLLLAFAAAVGLTLGWRTRSCFFVSWLHFVSACNHNFELLQGGDRLVIALLFWGMFLPTDACFSIDTSFADDAEIERLETAAAATASTAAAAAAAAAADSAAPTTAAAKASHTSTDGGAPAAPLPRLTRRQYGLRKRGPVVVEMATVGITVQMAVLYWCNALHKTDASE